MVSALCYPIRIEFKVGELKTNYQMFWKTLNLAYLTSL
jgi:hypothetical protein